jgi:hypothetical protein
MYLTYAEYQNMGGALDEATFNDLEFEAEALVNWYTFNRLKKDTTFPDELKRLMKYLIGLAYSKSGIINASGSGAVDTQKTIASQSNDGVSISYNILSAKDLMDSVKSESQDAIDKYLQGVMNEAGRLLLYRGVYPDE